MAFLESHPVHSRHNCNHGALSEQIADMQQAATTAPAQVQ